MAKTPEVELLELRLSQARDWIRMSPFGRVATTVGTFVFVYVCAGVLIISAMLVVGVNPTLVISVVAAPLWMGVMFAAWKVAKFLIGGKKSTPTADEHEEGGF